MINATTAREWQPYQEMQAKSTNKEKRRIVNEEIKIKFKIQLIWLKIKYKYYINQFTTKVKT